MALLTLPNLITLTRLAAIPVISYFYFQGRYDWALYLMMYAGFSDVLDGGLARYFSQRTKLGAILDPAADKLFMFVMFLTLGLTGKIPLWVTCLVIFRDVYIVAGVFVLKFKHKKVYIRPTYVSKMTTFFQLSLIFFCLLRSYLPLTSFHWLQNSEAFIQAAFQVSFYMTILFTIASGIHYTLVGSAIYRGNLDSEVSSV